MAITFGTEGHEIPGTLLPGVGWVYPGGYDPNYFTPAAPLHPYDPPTLHPAVTDEGPGAPHTPWPGVTWWPASLSGYHTNTSDASTGTAPNYHPTNEPAWTTTAPTGAQPNATPITPTVKGGGWRPWWATGVSPLTGNTPPANNPNTSTGVASWSETPTSHYDNSDASSGGYYNERTGEYYSGPSPSAMSGGTITGGGGNNSLIGGGIGDVLGGLFGDLSDPLFGGKPGAAFGGPAVTFKDVDVYALVARLAIIILGMVFVAVGLSMFRDNPVKIIVDKVKSVT